jgi:hypothetical protein
LATCADWDGSGAAAAFGGGEQRRPEVGAKRLVFLTRRGVSERSARSARSEFRGATSG